MIDYIVIGIILVALASITINYIKKKKEGRGSGCSGCSGCHIQDCSSRK